MPFTLGNYLCCVITHLQSARWSSVALLCPKGFHESQWKKRHFTHIKISMWIQFWEADICQRFPRWTPAIWGSPGILNYLGLIRSFEKTVRQLSTKRKNWKMNPMRPGCPVANAEDVGRKHYPCGLVSLAAGWRARAAGGRTFSLKTRRIIVEERARVSRVCCFCAKYI